MVCCLIEYSLIEVKKGKVCGAFIEQLRYFFKRDERLM